jgi:hypothetical protein
MSDEEVVVEGPMMPTAEQLQQRDADKDKRRHHHHHSHRHDRDRDHHGSGSRKDEDDRERKHSHSHRRHEEKQEPLQQPKSREDSGMSWMVRSLHLHCSRAPPPFGHARAGLCP